MSERVELVGVSKRFGDVIALEGIDLTVNAGEFVSLLGPSGCGKTTTLRIIAGFERPTSGDVRIGGRSVLGQSSVNRGIGMVFQNYALFPHMDVFENVAFGLRARRMRQDRVKSRVADMLDLVGLSHAERRKVHELSGGQQQRVALARALAIEPAVLLLDEPLGALDKKLREQMQIALSELHARLNMTMIYVTHDQEEALSMSDRIAVMDYGHVIQYDTASDLYHAPRTLSVCQFIGRTNTILDTVQRIEADTVVTRRGLHGIARELLAPGQECAVCIRPEKITLTSATAEAVSTSPLGATIRSAVFLGQITTYIGELGSGVRIEASVFSEAQRGHHFVGERVIVGYDAADAHVFSAGDTHVGEPSGFATPEVA